ncbi:serine carboxypeptidase S28 [Rhypophila sp. PSN 637]
MISMGSVSILRVLVLAFLFQADASPLWPNLTPPPLVAAVSAGSKGGNETFEQLIDHKNPELGTFSQRYWWDSTYWAGPGSPVLIFTPGETQADFYTGYLTNRTIMGLYAQEMGAAMVLFEHRYWGESSPFQYLDTKNLSYLNLENAVADMVHFAKNVKLPFDSGYSSNAPNAPWINVGGSYSGALAAWIDRIAPGTYWAYHASSGPVQAVYDYWSYFVPIQKGMPANCSADIAQIVNHVDKVLDEKNATNTEALKESFGLGDLAYDDDFAAALSSPLGMWQTISFTSNYSRFFQMCDTIEGVRAVDFQNDGNNVAVNGTGKWNHTISAHGVGLEKALPNFAAWYKYEFLPGYCADYQYLDWRDPKSAACFDTYNKTSPFVTDWSVNNTIMRQWYWMTCNEPFFYWQTSAPDGQPSIASRYITPEYFQRQCELLFPAEDGVTYGSAAGKTADSLNAWTGGWNFVNTTRVLWVNGEFDPWRSASVSSELRPGGPLQSTPEVPVYLLPKGIHCNDLNVRNAQANSDLKTAHKSMVKTMVKWVDDFYQLNGGRGYPGSANIKKKEEPF